MVEIEKAVVGVNEVAARRVGMTGIAARGRALRHPPGGDWSIARGGELLDIYNPRSYGLAKTAQAKRRRNMRRREVRKSPA